MCTASSFETLEDHTFSWVALYHFLPWPSFRVMGENQKLHLQLKISFLLWIWTVISVCCFYVTPNPTLNLKRKNKIWSLSFHISHFSGAAFHCAVCLCCRVVVWLVVVRPRQGRPGLGRKWQGSVLHLRCWCCQQVSQPPWPWPHYQGTPSMWRLNQLNWWYEIPLITKHLWN